MANAYTRKKRLNKSSDFVILTASFKAMDIQTRKLNFIQEFLKIQNEEAVSRFEDLLKKENKNVSKRDFSAMTIDEFNKRIDMSLADSENDNITEIHDILDEIAKWR